MRSCATPRDIEAGRHISSDATLELIAGNAAQFGENRLPILASIDLRERRVQGHRLLGIEFQQPGAGAMLDEIKGTGSLDAANVWCCPRRRECHRSRPRAPVAHQEASWSPRERGLDARCRQTRSRPSPTIPRAEERCELSRVQNLPQANEGPWCRRQGQRPIRPAPPPQRSTPSPERRVFVALAKVCSHGGSGSMAIKGLAPRSSSRRVAVPVPGPISNTIFPSAKPHRWTNVAKTQSGYCGRTEW